MNKYKGFPVFGWETIPLQVISQSKMPRNGIWDYPGLSPEISILAITYTPRNTRFIYMVGTDLLLEIGCCRDKLWCLKSQHSCPDSFPRKPCFCSVSWNIIPGVIYKPKMTGYSISMSLANWTQFKSKLSLPIMASYSSQSKKIPST